VKAQSDGDDSRRHRFQHYTLTSQGPLPVLDLGTLTSSGGDITRAEALEGGEVKAYAFSTSPDVLAIEIHLEDRVGIL